MTCSATQSKSIRGPASESGVGKSQRATGVDEKIFGIRSQGIKPCHGERGRKRLASLEHQLGN